MTGGLTFMIALAILGLLIFFGLFFTVQQGTVAIVTMFGKYRRVARAGLNLKIPFIESIFKRITIQNRSVELDFQAITNDQANVYFKAMLLYSVIDEQEQTLRNVAFKFVNDRDFMTALIRTIEGSIRSYVATKKQAEILGLRKEIVDDIKVNLDDVLEKWGFHLIDLQLNDISFDDVITKSMAQVVASSNLKAAAENEGQALLITKTKSAEADGNAIKIEASAEKEAAQMRGQGIALFRKEVAHGMSEAAKEMQENNLDNYFLLFSMWTEALKHFAETGKGNTIFLDGSADGMKRTVQQLMTTMNDEKAKEK